MTLRLVLLAVTTLLALSFIVGVVLNARRRSAWRSLAQRYGLTTKVPLHPLMGVAQATGAARGLRISLRERGFEPNRHELQLLTFFETPRELQPLIESARNSSGTFDEVFRVVREGTTRAEVDAPLKTQLLALRSHASVKYVALAPVGLTLVLGAHEPAGVISELVERSVDTLRSTPRC